MRTSVIAANYGDSTLSVLTNNGSGGFMTAGTIAVGSNPRAVVAVDVNGDGKVDLMTANYGANTVSVLTNGTPFPPPSLPIITTQPAGQTNLVGTTATFSVGATALVGQQLFRGLIYNLTLIF